MKIFDTDFLQTALNYKGIILNVRNGQMEKFFGKIQALSVEKMAWKISFT